MHPNSNYPVIRAERVVLQDERVAIGSPAAEARVELIRDGESIRAIDVICTCGERIRIVCEYD